MHLLLDQFEQVCRDRSQHLAVSDQALALDYQSLHAVVGGLASIIRESTPHPHVGLMAPPSAACAAAVLATWYAGKIPVPLNFLLPPEEQVHVIRDAEISFVVVTEHFAEYARQAGLNVLVLGPDTLRPGQIDTPAAQPDDLGVLIYTSGTAGVPKGVRLSFDNLVQNTNSCIEAAEITPDQNFLSLLPQFHAFGLTTNTIVPLLLGATVHYLPRFSPVNVVNTIAAKDISVFITIASMFGALAAMKNATAEQFRSLTLPVSGGEPLPPKVAEVFSQRYGKCIYEGYGMTEASPVITLNTPRAWRPGSVGRPLPGVAVVAVDPDGRELPTDQVGELVVRGHCVMQGYRNQPEQTAATIRNGALHTGDVGRVDAEGFVHITGRAKEMMIVGGENVFPIEIESALVSHPAVVEAAVIGVADDIRGEVPVAFVLLGSEAGAVTDNELRAFCREHLAAYKVPRYIYIREELPRGPTGKILKRALKVPDRE